MNDLPIVFGFVEDLLTAVRIDNVAQELGFNFIHWEEPEIDEQDEVQDPGPKWAEPLQGLEAAVIEKVSAVQPALIVFDLGNRSIPSLYWIALITSAPATRGIHVMAFGPHVDKEKLQSAKEAGADLTLARSKFMKNLPEVLSENAKVINSTELLQTCQDDLPHTAKKGLEQFNRGEYFKAHDSLELAWMEDQSAGRDLYRAILQVAVAYYQIERGNYNGAAKMFLRMRKWFAPLPESCRGINIQQLRMDVEAVSSELNQLGPDGIDRFDFKLLKPVEYKEIY
jgi:CheY-like chemotaxis protein